MEIFIIAAWAVIGVMFLGSFVMKMYKMLVIGRAMPGIKTAEDLGELLERFPGDWNWIISLYVDNGVKSFEEYKKLMEYVKEEEVDDPVRARKNRLRILKAAQPLLQIDIRSSLTEIFEAAKFVSDEDEDVKWFCAKAVPLLIGIGNILRLANVFGDSNTRLYILNLYVYKRGVRNLEEFIILLEEITEIRKRHCGYGYMEALEKVKTAGRPLIKKAGRLKTEEMARLAPFMDTPGEVDDFAEAVTDKITSPALATKLAMLMPTPRGYNRLISRHVAKHGIRGSGVFLRLLQVTREREFCTEEAEEAILRVGERLLLVDETSTFNELAEAARLARFYDNGHTERIVTATLSRPITADRVCILAHALGTREGITLLVENYIRVFGIRNLYELNALVGVAGKNHLPEIDMLAHEVGCPLLKANKGDQFERLLAIAPMLYCISESWVEPFLALWENFMTVVSEASLTPAEIAMLAKKMTPGKGNLLLVAHVKDRGIADLSDCIILLGGVQEGKEDKRALEEIRKAGKLWTDRVGATTPVADLFSLAKVANAEETRAITEAFIRQNLPLDYAQAIAQSFSTDPERNLFISGYTRALGFASREEFKSFSKIVKEEENNGKEAREAVHQAGLALGLTIPLGNKTRKDNQGGDLNLPEELKQMMKMMEAAGVPSGIIPIPGDENAFILIEGMAVEKLEKLGISRAGCI